MRLGKHNVMSRRLVLSTPAIFSALRATRAIANSFISDRLAWQQAWSAYRRMFIDDQGRVIDYTADDGFTTSEGQSYGLFFCLVSGEKDLFHQILSWTDTNMAERKLGEVLPVWKWGWDAGRWGPLSGNSAADADAWIAYCLLTAGHVWQDPTLTKQGKALASVIIAQESYAVPAGRVLLPGKDGFPKSPPLIVNPSYMPGFIMAGIATLTGDPAWREIAHAVPAILAAVSRHGFAPDWAWYPTSPAAGTVPPVPIGIGSYDAIRTYLWAGMNAPDMPGAGETLQCLQGMDAYLTEHQFAPRTIDINSGSASGISTAGFAGALLPYLARVGNKKSLRLLRAVVDQARQSDDIYGAPQPHYTYESHYTDTRYYKENLILFGLGATAGMFSFDKAGLLKLS